MSKAVGKRFFSHLVVLLFGLWAGWWLHALLGDFSGSRRFLPGDTPSVVTTSDNGSVDISHSLPEKTERGKNTATLPSGQSEQPTHAMPPDRSERSPHVTAPGTTSDKPASASLKAKGAGKPPSPKESDPSTTLMQKGVTLYHNRDLGNLIIFVQENEDALGEYYPGAVTLLQNLLREITNDLTKRGYFQKALDTIDAYLDFDPHHMNAVDMKASIYTAIDRPLAAYDLYMDSLFYTDDPGVEADLRAKAINIIENRIRALSAKKEWGKLMGFFENFLQRDLENTAGFQLGLARLYLMFNREDEAVNLAEEVLLSDSGNREALALIQQVQKEREDDGLIVVPVIKRKNQFYVKSIINGEVETLLLIDTGATYCSLAASIVEELPYGSITELGERNFRTAGGHVRRSVIRVDSISIGNALVQNPIASVSDVYASERSPMKGLLGMNFLSLFDFYFDQDKNNILLRPKPAESRH